LDNYLEGHYRYAKYCLQNGYVRYEDFTADPSRVMRQICDHLDVDYDPGFINKWFDYVNITGDDFFNAPETNIRPALLPEVDSEFYDRLHQCEYYQQTLDLLGYDDVRVK
jgi:hypothetical protein